MYKAQEKSWMDSEIFTEWIKQLDQKFLAQNRKVAFIVDNCPVDPHVPDLTTIDLIFFFVAKHNLSNTAYGSRNYTIVES